MEKNVPCGFSQMVFSCSLISSSPEKRKRSLRHIRQASCASKAKRTSSTGDVFKMIMITIWLFNIAMENGPFIDGLPIKNGDFPWLCDK